MKKKWLIFGVIVCIFVGILGGYQYYLYHERKQNLELFETGLDGFYSDGKIEILLSDFVNKGHILGYAIYSPKGEENQLCIEVWTKDGHTGVSLSSRLKGNRSEIENAAIATSYRKDNIKIEFFDDKEDRKIIGYTIQIYEKNGIRELKAK
ncbi:MAG: hypothetical protein Q4D45_00975 [Lachnospiraceae bacterium]|nr:hypothetical protein [Lachnospiraceae bacterium]